MNYPRLKDNSINCYGARNKSELFARVNFIVFSRFHKAYIARSNARSFAFRGI